MNFAHMDEMFCEKLPIGYNTSMPFEEFPKSREHSSEEYRQLHEARDEQLENKAREDALYASFILIGSALGCIGTAGCDINKTIAPEAQTSIITVSNEVEKKFEEGIIKFNICAPKTENYGDKEIEISQSFIAIEDAERVDESGKKSYYGARFIKERPEGAETTFIAVNFFVDNQKAYEAPCSMQRIQGSAEESDRYAFLISNLNLRLNILNALKQMPGAYEELGAVRAHAEEFAKLLNKEFPDGYDRKLVENILE